MRTFHTAAPLAALATAVFLAASSVRPSLAVEPTVVVQPGDTLIGIAGRMGVTVEQLVELNGLGDPNRILVGQVLWVIPAGDVQAPPSDGTIPNTHLVRPGENLTGIAVRYGTTVAELSRLNGIADPSLIFAGQQLELPVTAPPSSGAGAAAWTDHVVRPGENLTGIATAYGTSVGALVEANGLANPSLIYAGSVIRVSAALRPAASAAPPSSAPAAAPSAAPSAAPTSVQSAGRGAADSSVSPLPMPEWMQPLVAERDAVRSLIVEEAEALGVPPAFALSVAWQESGFQQSVVSSSGAVGVMQLLPETAEWVAVAMLGEPVDINDTASNVRAGVRLLRHYLDRYDGSRELALAAYYQGQYAADTYGIYEVTRPYIASILLHERFFAR